MDDPRLFTIMATPVEVPTAVDRSRWPVHVTLAGNFHVGPLRHDALSADFTAIAATVKAFAVRLGPAARFGAAHDTPVLLAEHPMFHRVHTAFAARLTQHPGFAAVEPAYWADGYRPHATLGVAVSAVEGELLDVRWLTLVAIEGPVGRPISAVELAGH